ncbi:MAG TPA: LysR family transcriptional regulator [Candidatus Brachybacterium merdavium]|uniref:LysR family transcriptional regulator n=1 Tax=Candidatus Brachybacterium merdavium TaxID=2838513 RepID=A0A9D2RPN3_9MICO|nr:LysR family transcriptional regulator [Candidatus Brachybacterium merdavium]
MELHQMRYVLAVAHARSFTRAAEACHVVQSALSQQISKLERELGVPLFSRSSRRVELTAAGAAFVPWARTTLDAVDRAAAEAVAADGVVSGPLRIGLIPTPSALDVPDFLRRLHRTYPQVTAQLRVGSSDRLISEVGEGNLDLALVGLADGTTPQRVEHRALAREALVAVLPVEHSAATGSSISRVLTLADMAEEPFADFPAGSPGRLQSDLAFRAAGLARDVRYEAATPGLIVDVVAAGLAVALLPQTFARGEGVTTRTVADGPHRTEYLVWDGFSPSAATRAALSLLDP